MYLVNNSLIYGGLDSVPFQCCLLLYFWESLVKSGMYFSQELGIFVLTLCWVLIVHAQNQFLVTRDTSSGHVDEIVLSGIKLQESVGNKSNLNQAHR